MRPDLPSPEYLALTRQKEIEEASEKAVLKSDRKRSTSDRSLSATAGGVDQAARARADYGRQEQDDGDPEAALPVHFDLPATRSESARKEGYCRTLEQVELDRTESILPGRRCAESCLFSWLKETRTLLQHKRDSVARLMANGQPTEHVCMDGRVCHGPVPLDGHREVSYVSMEACFPIRVPQYRCPRCRWSTEMSPLVARCIANAPVVPSVYFDLGLLATVHHFKVQSGMGDTRVSNALNEVWQYSYLFGRDCHLIPVVQPVQLGDAYRWFRNMLGDFGEPETMIGTPLETEYTPGTFGRCPVCAGHHPTSQDCHPPATVGWVQYKTWLVRDFDAHLTAAVGADANEASTAAAATATTFMAATSSIVAEASEAVAWAAESVATADVATSASGSAHTESASAVAPVVAAAANSVVATAHPAIAPAAALLVAASEAAPAVAQAVAAPVAVGVATHISELEFVIPGRKSGRVAKKPLQRPMIVSIDGGQKFTHYAKCGVQHTAVWNSIKIRPMKAHYLTPKLDRAYVRYSAYTKEVARNKAAATAERASSSSAPADDPAVEHETVCQADLLAARSTAPSSKSAHTDVKVVLGCVCSHVVPGRGMFVSLPDPENFSGVDAMLVTKLRSEPGCFDAVCFDVNCRYDAHFKAHHPEYHAQIPNWLVGWLHSNAGHNVSCQLQFCGLFYEKLGRCIGEQMEQLWAFLKPFAKSSRYMSLARRNEYLNDLLEYFANTKYEGSAALTCQTHAITIRQQHKLAEDIERLLSSPEGRALVRDQPYVLETTTSLPTDRRVQYVKTLMEMSLHSSMLAAGGSHLAASMHKTSGPLLTKAKLLETCKKLEARLCLLEKQLKINPRWTFDDDVFQEYHARLCDVQISIHQVSIEKEVSVVVTLEDHHEQEGPSTHQSQSLVRRIKDRREKIRELLAGLEDWTEQAGYPVYDLSEDDVISNRLPWQTGGEYKNCSTDFLRLKLYKMECELKRCDEELVYLPSDAVKTLLYFGKQISLLQAWLMKEHTIGSAPSGKVILMFDRMRKVERLYDDAFARFKKCGLIQEAITV